MGANSSRQNARRSGSGHGRHRAPRRVEPYAWLGAGAVTVGLGAAFISGAGVASADEGSGGDGSSSSSSSASAGPTSPSSRDPSTSTSTGSPSSARTAAAADDTATKNEKYPSNAAAPSSTLAVSSDATPKKKPFSSFSSTPGELTTVGKPSLNADPAAGAENAQLHVEATPAQAPRGYLSDGRQPLQPVITKGKTLTTPVTSSVIEADDTNQTRPVVPLALATATATLTSSSEVDPSTTTASARVVNSAASAAAPEDPAVIAQIKFGDFVEGLRDLVIDPVNGDRVYIGSTLYQGPNANGVAVINTRTDAQEGYVPVAGGNQQRYLGIGPDGRYVYVGSGNDGTYVSVIDTKDNSVKSIPVTLPGTISGLAVSPDSRFVYAGLYNTGSSANGTELAIIDTTTNTLVARIPSSGYITQTRIAVNPTNGDVYVNGGSNVLVLDGATGTVRRSIDDAGGRLLISQDGRQLYAVSNTGLSTINLDTYGVTKTSFAVTGQQLGGVAVSPNGRYLYLTTSAPSTGAIGVSVIDTTTSKVVAQIPVGFEYGGNSLAMSPNGNRLYLYTEVDSESNSPRVVVIDTTKINLSGGSSGGQNPGGHTNPIDEILNAVSFSNEVTKWLDNLSKTYNLGAVLSGYQFVNGVTSILDGFKEGDTLKILDGFSDVAQTFLKGPAAIALEGAKLVISIVLPLNAEDSAKFFDFRVQCMFHKGSGDLSTNEAQQLVDRYTGVASILNIPADYARYNVGGWFGTPAC